MTGIETAEFYEDEINPNMYAGAAHIARILAIERDEAARNTSDIPMNEDSTDEKTERKDS